MGAWMIETMAAEDRRHARLGDNAHRKVELVPARELRRSMRRLRPVIAAMLLGYRHELRTAKAVADAEPFSAHGVACRAQAGTLRDVIADLTYLAEVVSCRP